MATNKDQISILTSAPTTNVKTPLVDSNPKTTKKVAPPAMTMDEESTCHPHVKEGAEKTALAVLGGAIDAGIAYGVGCGPTGMGIAAAVQAGLCFLGGKQAAECFFSKCDDSADNLFPVEPKAFAINMS